VTFLRILLRIARYFSLVTISEMFEGAPEVISINANYEIRENEFIDLIRVIFEYNSKTFHSSLVLLERFLIQFAHAEEQTKP